MKASTLTPNDDLRRRGQQVGAATRLVACMLEALWDTLQKLAADQVKSFLRLLTKGDLTLAEAMKKLSLLHRPIFRSNYVQPALKMGLIEMTKPDGNLSILEAGKL